MSVEKRRQRLRALLAEDVEREYQRFIDLCLVWELPNGETMYVGGGQWDCEESRYTDREPESGKVIRLQPAQVEPAQWLAWWLQERMAGRPRDFVTLQLMGDRGATKTYFAVAAMLMLAVEAPRLRIPESIGWMTSKSFEERDELDRELRGMAPAQWWRHNEERKRYNFPTGATLTNVSADDPENLKRGRVDWLLLNEIQKIGRRAYLNGLARLKDKGGFSMLTGNWPTDKRGQWIYELDEKRADAVKAGKTYPVRLVKMSSSGNLTLDVQTADQVAQIIRDLDPLLAATDLDGIKMPVTKVAYWEWDKDRNLRSRPDADRNSIVRDITAEITAKKTMRRGGYQYLIGADFQRNRSMVAVIHKVFGTIEEPIAWAIDEILVMGTEEDLVEELHAQGYTPENSLIIADGSGRHQDGAHSGQRTSFDVIRSARYRCEGPVKPRDDQHRPRNPLFNDRCRLHNWGLKFSRYMVDPKGCPVLAEGLSKCELIQGRTGQDRPGGGRHADVTDAGGYPLWWLYPEKTKGPSFGMGGKRLFESIVDLMRARQVIA